MSTDRYGVASEMTEVLRIIAHPPMDFVMVDRPGVCAWKKIDDGVFVVISESMESDNRRWLHVSCSRPNRIPTWQDVRRVKDAFVGKNRKAIQVLPCEAEYVNLHPFVLHLWCCLDGDPLPDFRKGGLI
jgi:hypothetical protein